MPTCTECGIDIPQDGLCTECSAERAGKEKQGEGGSGRLTIGFIVFAAALIFAAAFFFGQYFGTNSTGGAEAAAGPAGSARLADASGEQGKVESNGAGTKESNSGTATAVQAASNAEGPAAKKTGTPDSDAQSAGADGGLEPVFDVRTLPAGLPYESKDSYLEWMLENTDQKEEFLIKKWERYRWVQNWSRKPALTEERVLRGFLKTPREYFCREWNVARAYDHAFLSIGYGQTISGPEIVSRMTNALNPEPDHKVLEVGTGSGYQSAFLAELANFVYTIEIVEPLAEATDEIYASLEEAYPQYANVRRKVDDGYFGWETNAPFDRIIVTCGIDHIPPPLLKQLSPDGIMVIPVGPPAGQTILKVTKRVDADGTVILEREDIYKGTPVKTDRFVPFTTKDGGVHSKSRDSGQGE